MEEMAGAGMWRGQHDVPANQDAVSRAACLPPGRAMGPTLSPPPPNPPGLAGRLGGSKTAQLRPVSIKENEPSSGSRFTDYWGNRGDVSDAPFEKLNLT